MTTAESVSCHDSSFAVPVFSTPSFWVQDGSSARGRQRDPRSPVRPSRGNLAQSAQHQPRTLLRDAQLFSKPRACDIRLSLSSKHSRQPLMQRDVASLHDRCRADCKVERTGVAPVVSALASGNAVVGFALRANGTGGPQSALQVGPSSFFVGNNSNRRKVLIVERDI